MKNWTAIALVVLIGIILFYKSYKKEYYTDDYGKEIIIGNEKVIPFTNIPHGKCYYYSKNGTLETVINYKIGKRDGEMIEYHSNGKIKCVLKYDSDRLNEIKLYQDDKGVKLNYGELKNGNGFIRIYYENGMINEEGGMKNGMRDGVWKSYSNKKDVYILTTYNKGFSHDFEFFVFVEF